MGISILISALFTIKCTHNYVNANYDHHVYHAKMCMYSLSLILTCMLCIIYYVHIVISCVLCMCVCACVRACVLVRACVRACVRASVLFERLF